MTETPLSSTEFVNSVEDYADDVEDELRNCPTPNAGWITKGDANPEYDQSAGRHGVVSSEDIERRVLLAVDDETWDITRLST